MRWVTNKLSELFWWDTLKTKRNLDQTSKEICDTISSDSILGFDFHENLSLEDARTQLVDFSNLFSLDSIKNMQDFNFLQKLVKEMSDYLLKNQYEIKKLALWEMQDFKLSFREIQEKIRRMYQDEEFIKKLVTNNDMLSYDKETDKNIRKELKQFYEWLTVVYNAVVAAFRVDTYIPIPEEMKIMESFPESFEAQLLAKSKKAFVNILWDIKNMSDYILENEDEIGKFPAVQLFDFKITLEWIIEEVGFMLQSDIFDQPQLYNLKKLNEPDWRLYKAYETVNEQLKFTEKMPLEKAVDLISTFWHRMNTEEISQNIEKFWVFLQELKLMSRYMINYKIEIKNLPISVLKELKKWLEDVEDRIGKILELKNLQPKITYNLNRVLKKDLRTAKTITEI